MAADVLFCYSDIFIDLENRNFTREEKLMQGKLRNMTTIYLFREGKVLMLYRIGSRVVLQPSWCGIGGHFEKEELNDAMRYVRFIIFLPN